VQVIAIYCLPNRRFVDRKIKRHGCLNHDIENAGNGKRCKKIEKFIYIIYAIYKTSFIHYLPQRKELFMKNMMVSWMIIFILFLGVIVPSGLPVCYASDNETDNATEIVSAAVRLVPRTYNLNRNGRYLTALVIFPAGITAAEVVENSIQLTLLADDNGTGDNIYAVSATPVPWDVTMLNVKFDNREVKDLIQSYYQEFPVRVRCVVSGSLENGKGFSGEDSIMVIAPGKKGKGGKK